MRVPRRDDWSSDHTRRKPTAPAGRPSPSVHGRDPTCQPLSSLGQVGCARSSLVSHCACAISGECAAHALATCARPAALVRVDPCLIEAHCASGTAVSLGARPCSDVRAPASNERVTCASKCSLNRTRSLFLSGGSAARALATCTRPAALTRVGPYPLELHCASGMAVSLGARPCSDVPALVLTWSGGLQA